MGHAEGWCEHQRSDECIWKWKRWYNPGISHSFVGVQSYLQISCHVSLYLPSRCCSFTKPYLQYRKIIQRFSSRTVSACFYVCLDRNMCQIKGKQFVSLWEVKELDVSVLIVYIVEREGGKKHLKHCLIKIFFISEYDCFIMWKISF